MQARPIPAVWGPDGKLYITDHHHLGRAASEAAVDTGFFWIEDDFSNVPIAQFWPKMLAGKWAQPIDQHGQQRSFEDIPDHLEKLLDDPNRSLAGYVRDAGGYDKTPTAFAPPHRRRRTCPDTRDRVERASAPKARGRRARDSLRRS
jgi:hypothetical protein